MVIYFIVSIAFLIIVLLAFALYGSLKCKRQTIILHKPHGQNLVWCLAYYNINDFSADMNNGIITIKSSDPKAIELFDQYRDREVIQ